MRKQLRNLYLNIVGRFSNPKPGIHIINSHYVTPDYVDVERDTKIFENYLNFLSKWAKFITLEEATKRILEKDIPTDEVLIAFTFDDGFEECYTVIAPLLEKYNTRGAFFINANYIESSIEYQKSYHTRVNSKTKLPMTWKQVKQLHSNGHIIGSHNLDHVNFAEMNVSEIEQQIVVNKKILESKLNYQCDYFAWTYGQFKNYPNIAHQVVKKYHKYIFSGTNSKSYFSLNEEVLNRRHQEAFWPKNHNRYFISVKKRIK